MPELPAPHEKEKVLEEELISAPLSEVAALIFGPNTEWFHNFLADVEKNEEVGDIPAFASYDKEQTRYFEYVKPLNGPVGPKQTRCQSTEVIESWDSNGIVQVQQTTVTPDVPSGDAFTTLTSIVMAATSKETTTVRIGTWLEWSGRSWLKAPIEKGAMSGQASYTKDLVAELNKAVSKGDGASSPADEATVIVRGSRKSDHRGSKKKSSKRSKTQLRASFLRMVILNCVITLSIILVGRKLLAPTTPPPANVAWSAPYLPVAIPPSVGHVERELQLKELQVMQWLDAANFDQLTNQELDSAIQLTNLRLDRLLLSRKKRD